MSAVFAVLASIAKAFEKIGLSIKIMSEPIRGANNPVNKTIFQMDVESIRKGSRRTERFRIYPGGEKNKIQILDTDVKDQQVLLLVSEPVQEWEDSVKITKSNTYERIVEGLKRGKFFKIRKIGDRVFYRGKTPGGNRHFLMGVDERQLFIAQLEKPATSVPMARKSLGRTVQFADGKVDTKRQGEWFLLETTQATRDAIEDAIKKTRTVVRKNASIGQFAGKNSGKKHNAEELIVMPSGMVDTKAASEFRLRRNRVFVRGKISHPDHKTKNFNQWREVILNSEGQTGTGTAAGVFFID